MTSFLGLRSTSDFVANELDANWRAGILREMPNGKMPLTALTSRMPTRKLLEGPIFYWWSKALPTQRVSLTADEAYVDPTLITKYVRATHLATIGQIGGVVYFKMTAANAGNFIEGHVVLMRDASDSATDLRGKVVSISINGASSSIGVKLIEIDDNGSTPGTYNLTTVDVLLIIGTANPQGGERPEAVAQEVVQSDNQAQIFRNAVDMTRTAYRTKLRTVKDPLKEARRDALEFHGIEMEKAFIFGKGYQGTGANGKPEYFTKGIIEMITAGSASTVVDFATDDATSSSTWLQAGEEFLDRILEIMFRNGETEKLALCGSGALLGIQRLAKQTGQINLTPESQAFGMDIQRWRTPFGTIFLKSHPLFSYEVTNRYMMLILEPAKMTYSYVDDTFFREDKTWLQGGGSGKDGIEEDYTTEAGLELHYPSAHGIINNVGVDN